MEWYGKHRQAYTSIYNQCLLHHVQHWIILCLQYTIWNTDWLSQCSISYTLTLLEYSWLKSLRFIIFITMEWIHNWTLDFYRINAMYHVRTVILIMLMEHKCKMYVNLLQHLSIWCLCNVSCRVRLQICLCFEHDCLNISLIRIVVLVSK